MNKNTAMYLWTSVNWPHKDGLWRWPHLHTTACTQYSWCGRCSKSCLSTHFIQCKLEILMRFSRVAFFSEYWIYNVVIYSVAFYTEMWYFSKERSDSIGVIPEPMISWAAPGAHIVPNRSMRVCVKSTSDCEALNSLLLVLKSAW